MEKDIPPEMLNIIERLEAGEDVPIGDLQSLEKWYTNAVQKLKDDIEITKLRKNLDI